jgi:hypothetical protein
MGSHVVCRRKGQIGENGENDQLVRADAITTHLINCIDSKVYIIQFHLIIGAENCYVASRTTRNPINASAVRIRHAFKP